MQAPVVSITALFSSSNLNNLNITQLMNNLANKSFSFDLKSDSALPTSLLTSTKYDISDCVSNCSNSGTCKLLNGMKFICECNPNFTGSKCNIDLRPCSQNPCLNYLKCENILNYTDSQLNQNIYSDFKCICKSDLYSGKRCENKVNLCLNETCSNNGICQIINENSFNETTECKCFGTNQYEGSKCETKSSKLVVRETTVKTTYLIAIIILVSTYLLIILSDLHNIFTHQDFKAKRKNNKIIHKPRHLIYLP